MGEIKLRKANLSDSYGIANVHVQSWIETYKGLMPDRILDDHCVNKRKKLWDIEIPKSQNLNFVVECENNNIIGFISAGPSRDLVEHASFEIYALYLLKRYHGTGLGYKLFNEVQFMIPNKNIILWVLHNSPTRVFYERLDGKVISHKKDIVFGEEISEVAYLMSAND